ncbi:MAG: DUF4160 domain-containing protein [Acetobacter aceti]|uniref:DUF4160 domain-containing protein n=1 Tax=Acetobacter aceti TaxID=435 RepID=A0A1U9KJQ8_ACEAC|nr:DUF4160 domain-containing protein [Acetobacter aceti]AQS86030.1 hypothetical protein A0U92_16130 [Acetobacter aceti]
MPTVLRFAGFRVVIYPNDHHPAHVHVIGGDGEAVFVIGKPARLIRSTGLSARDITTAQDVIEKNAEKLIQEWSAIHGNRN